MFVTHLNLEKVSYYATRYEYRINYGWRYRSTFSTFITFDNFIKLEFEIPGANLAKFWFTSLNDNLLHKTKHTKYTDFIANMLETQTLIRLKSNKRIILVKKAFLYKIKNGKIQCDV